MDGMSIDIDRFSDESESGSNGEEDQNGTLAMAGQEHLANKILVKLQDHQTFWLIVSLVFMTIDFCMDVKTIIDYFSVGKNVSFVLYLGFTALPASLIHLFVTNRLKPDIWWQRLFYFVFAPWLLLLKYINLSGKNTTEEAFIKETVIIMKVVESVFEGVPQLCIQVASLWIEPEIGLTDEIKIMVKVAPLAFALLAEFSKDMPFLWKVINCLPVALVLGARLFVLVSLFALRDAFWLTCFIPPFLGFFAAWLLSHEQGSRRVTEALVKTLLYPPSDRAGIVPSAMYVIVYGLAVFLDPNSESTGPYWVLLFHIVGGFLWWFVLENKYKRA